VAAVTGFLYVAEAFASDPWLAVVMMMMMMMMIID
jgi:hypothetical protein